jgi:hypothetical protein
VVRVCLFSSESLSTVYPPLKHALPQLMHVHKEGKII